MVKNVILLISIIGIIAFGIGYAFLNDPEQPARQLVKLTLQEFFNYAGELEEEYSAHSLLKENTKELLIVLTLSEKVTQESVKLTVENNQVTLLFNNENSILVGQTIILEPFNKNNQINWYCINGSVLVRLRNKDCRIGNGILTSDYIKSDASTD
jgi:hypothetical protein